MECYCSWYENENEYNYVFVLVCEVITGLFYVCRNLSCVLHIRTRRPLYSQHVGPICLSVWRGVTIQEYMIHTQLSVVWSAGSVLYREVTRIQGVLQKEVPL